jgi:DNA-binding MarR family transcriptional regulator
MGVEMNRPNATKPTFGLSEEEAQEMGEDNATRIRTLRAVLLLAQILRTRLDNLYRADGLTTQQATLLSIVRSRGTPTLGQVAETMGTSHQNVKQLVIALERKGFLEYIPDPHDARIRRLHTTAQNEQYWKDRDPDDFSKVLPWFDNLNPNEAETLLELVGRLYGNLREEPPSSP